MESLLNTVKCIQCKCILQSPIILPCYRSVCEKHVPKNGVKFYNCQACGQDHYIPENGYAPNDAVNLLIDLNLGEYKQAASACESLRTRIEQLEALKNEPRHEIDTAVDELKAQVRSRRDELVKEIETKSELIIVELDHYQSECVEALGVHENVLNEVNVRLEDGKKSLGELVEDLNSVEAASQAKWKMVLERSELEARELALNIEQIKSILLLRKFDEFKMKAERFCQLIVDYRPVFYGHGQIETDRIDCKLETTEVHPSCSSFSKKVTTKTCSFGFKTNYISL